MVTWVGFILPFPAERRVTENLEVSLGSSSGNWACLYCSMAFSSSFNFFFAKLSFLSFATNFSYSFYLGSNFFTNSGSLVNPLAYRRAFLGLFTPHTQPIHFFWPISILTKPIYFLHKCHISINLPFCMLFKSFNRFIKII